MSFVFISPSDVFLCVHVCTLYACTCTQTQIKTENKCIVNQKPYAT